MNNRNFIRKLKKLDACQDAVGWCEQHGGSLEELWQDCERGEWMWWLLAKTAMPTKEQSVKFARWCAKRSAAYSADATAYSADATAYSADATAYSADAATYAAAVAAAVAADAAAYAAAYAYAADDAYAAYAYAAERKAQAKYIRQNFTCPKGK